MIEAAEDECARFLDLAAFAEERLDPDERERIADWLRTRPEAAGDIAAARSPTSAAQHDALSEAVVARACALVGAAVPDRAMPDRAISDQPGAPRRSGSVVAFRPRAGQRPVLGTVAQWSSLAAALVVAGWLGFTLGMDTSGMLAHNGGPGGGPGFDDGVVQDLFGPSPGFFPDLTGGA